MREPSHRNRSAAARVSSRMKLMPGLLLALVLPLAVAACTGPVPPVTEPSASLPPTSSPAPIAAGETDCGVFVLDQGQGLAETAMRCVIDAAAQGRLARLRETRPTVEGDPVFISYRVKAGGVVEVTRDFTHDKFGSQGIVTETCTGPIAERGMLSFARCAP